MESPRVCPFSYSLFCWSSGLRRLPSLQHYSGLCFQMQTCIFNYLHTSPTCISKGISNLKYWTTPMLPHLSPTSSSSFLHFQINANSTFPNAQTTLLEVILDSSLIHTQYLICQQFLSTQTSIYMWNHQASSLILFQPDPSPLLPQLNCRNCLSTHLLFLPCPSVP